MRRRINTHQTKLIWSLVLNFATRLPGAVGLIVILPLMKFSLGNANYAALLSLIALGSVLTFLFGGFNIVARRKIGQAFADNDPQKEANAFLSIMAVNSGIAVLAGALAISYTLYNRGSGEEFFVPLLVLFGALVNTFDNVRASYNEHYITALLQIAFQSALLTMAITFPVSRSSIYIDSIYLTGHTILASLITGYLLIKERSYLLKGKPVEVKEVFKGGITLSLSDGLVMAALNLSVVFVGAGSTPRISAWYATLVRLFQTILTPALLLVVPLSSFVRIRWASWPHARQRAVLSGAMLIGLTYGVASVLGLGLLSHLYIGKAMSLRVEISAYIRFSIYLFFSMLIAYKSFTAILFVLFDNASITRKVAISSAGTIGLGLMLQYKLSPLLTVSICSIFLSLMLLYAIVVGGVVHKHVVDA